MHLSTMPALGIMKANTAENATGECVTSGEITGLGSLLNWYLQLVTNYL